MRISWLLLPAPLPLELPAFLHLPSFLCYSDSTLPFPHKFHKLTMFLHRQIPSCLTWSDLTLTEMPEFPQRSPAPFATIICWYLLSACLQRAYAVFASTSSSQPRVICLRRGRLAMSKDTCDCHNAGQGLPLASSGQRSEGASGSNLPWPQGQRVSRPQTPAVSRLGKPSTSSEGGLLITIFQRGVLVQNVRHPD